MIIGDGIMLGAGGESASIFVTGVSETNNVNATHKVPVKIPNPEWKSLPDGYTQLEYIESTGTQYIDTGITITQNIGVYLDFVLNNAISSSNVGTFFGGAGSGNSCWICSYNRYQTGSFDFGPTHYEAFLTSGKRMQLELKEQTYTTSEGGNISLPTTSFNTNLSAYLFAANNKGTAHEHANFRLYSSKLYDGSTVVRNFIPCKRISDSVIGLYDLVNNVFYTNAGTGTFTAGSEIPAYIEMTVDDKTLTGKWKSDPNPVFHGLPDGYTQLEYIEGTGTQYIDTGIKPNTNTKIAMSFSGLSGYHLFDSGGDGINRNAFCGWYQSTDHNYTTFWATDSYPNTGSTTYKFGTGDYDIEFSAGLLVVNGESISFEKRTFSMGTSLKLYRCGNSNGRYKLKSFRHYNEDVLVNEYIPCKRLSDGVIGMYDLVSTAFYGNSGTGEFVAGPEIPQTIDGFLIDKITSYGTWTVTATDGTHTKTQDVLVDSAIEYDVSISYIDERLQIWLNGSGYTDESLVGNAVTNYGTSLVTSDDFPYYAFDGSNHYIQFPSQTIAPNDFAISLWAYFDSFYAYERLFDFGEGNAKDLWCGHTSSSGVIVFGYQISGTGYRSSSVTLASGAWHHVAIKGENGITTLYVDGVSVASMSISSSELSLANCYLGKSNWDDNYLHGRIADFRLYNTTITEAEIIELYQSGAYVPN